MPVPDRDVNGVLGLRFFSEIEFKAPVGSDRGCSGGRVGEGGALQMLSTVRTWPNGPCEESGGE